MSAKRVTSKPDDDLTPEKVQQDRVEDYLNKGLKAAIGALPLVGSTAAEFFNFVVGDPAQERRDDFMKGLFDRIVAIEGQPQLTPENLRENEQFQATVVQAVRLASSTASADKKRLLQNAIINSALFNIDETLRQTLIQILDRISPMHVSLLTFFDNPRNFPAGVARMQQISMGSIHTAIDAALPGIMRDQIVFDQVMEDLQAWNLADTASTKAIMTSHGTLEPRIKSLGRIFLQFVTRDD